MTNLQKILFLGVIPLAAAGMGAGATYLADTRDKEQIVITGEAAQAAKDGKLTIEIIRKEEDANPIAWELFIFPLSIFGFAAMLYGVTRQ